MKVKIEDLRSAIKIGWDICDFLSSEFFAFIEDLEGIGYIDNLYEKVWGKNCKLNMSLDEQLTYYEDLLDTEDVDNIIKDYRSEFVTFINYMNKVRLNVSKLVKLKDKFEIK